MCCILWLTWQEKKNISVEWRREVQAGAASSNQPFIPGNIAIRNSGSEWGPPREGSRGSTAIYLRYNFIHMHPNDYMCNFSSRCVSFTVCNKA